MFNTGYFSHTDHVDPSYWDLAEPLDGMTLSRVGALTRGHRIYVIAPFIEKAARDVYYNSATLIDRNGKVMVGGRYTFPGLSRDGKNSISGPVRTFPFLIRS